MFRWTIGNDSLSWTFAFLSTSFFWLQNFFIQIWDRIFFCCWSNIFNNFRFLCFKNFFRSLDCFIPFFLWCFNDDNILFFFFQSMRLIFLFKKIVSNASMEWNVFTLRDITILVKVQFFEFTLNLWKTILLIIIFILISFCFLKFVIFKIACMEPFFW